MVKWRPTPLPTAVVAAIVVVVLGVTTLVMCGRGDEPSGPGPSTTTLVASPLTGLADGGGKPVLAVKIDNLAAARPQTGLTQADLVYVEPVEGGLSRFMAVFSSRLPPVVGPVRSARESDLELLRQFDRPALAFSGAAPELLPLIDGAPLVSLPPAKAGDAYFTERGRSAPHNTYAWPEKLMAHAREVGPAKDIGFKFGDLPAGGTPTARHTERYPATEMTFDWSAGEGRWLVSMDGSALSVAEGGRVGAATVVIQRVTVRPSRFFDVRGSVSPYAETVGAGNALVLRDGQSFPAWWSRPNADAGTAFTTPSGEPMPFARGPVWIVLVPA